MTEEVSSIPAGMQSERAWNHLKSLRLAPQARMDRGIGALARCCTTSQGVRRNGSPPAACRQLMPWRPAARSTLVARVGTPSLCWLLACAATARGRAALFARENIRRLRAVRLLLMVVAGDWRSGGECGSALHVKSPVRIGFGFVSAGPVLS
jgi:hypothetical protein